MSSMIATTTITEHNNNNTILNSNNGVEVSSKENISERNTTFDDNGDVNGGNKTKTLNFPGYAWICFYSETLREKGIVHGTQLRLYDVVVVPSSVSSSSSSNNIEGSEDEDYS